MRKNRNSKYIEFLKTNKSFEYITETLRDYIVKVLPFDGMCDASFTGYLVAIPKKTIKQQYKLFEQYKNNNKTN